MVNRERKCACDVEKRANEDGSLHHRRLKKDKNKIGQGSHPAAAQCKHHYIIAPALMDGWLSVMGMLSVCRLLKELLAMDEGGAMPPWLTSALSEPVM